MKCSAEYLHCAFVFGNMSIYCQCFSFIVSLQIDNLENVSFCLTTCQQSRLVIEIGTLFLSVTYLLKLLNKYARNVLVFCTNVLLLSISFHTFHQFPFLTRWP
uniref:Uncharacterized protein n=1 Tax=Cacopsylla melanoneura TaxID=428564 RepID=A0A8D8QT04_9HEMI